VQSLLAISCRVVIKYRSMQPTTALGRRSRQINISTTYWHVKLGHRVLASCESHRGITKVLDQQRNFTPRVSRSQESLLDAHRHHLLVIAFASSLPYPSAITWAYRIAWCEWQRRAFTAASQSARQSSLDGCGEASVTTLSMLRRHKRPPDVSVVL